MHTCYYSILWCNEQELIEKQGMMKVIQTTYIQRKKLAYIQYMNMILWCVTLSPIFTPSRILKVELCFIRTNDSGVVWFAEAEAMAWRNPEQ